MDLLSIFTWFAHWVCSMTALHLLWVNSELQLTKNKSGRHMLWIVLIYLRLCLVSSELRMINLFQIAKNTTPMYRAPEMLDLYQNFAICEASDVWVSIKRRTNEIRNISNYFLTLIRNIVHATCHKLYKV